jgi:dienelactone hydrolase
MVTQCCISGFQWNGTPTGREDKIAGNDAYIVGSNNTAAILVIADLFGWSFTNTRLLCDAYSAEANTTVYMPDFFGGQVIDPSIIANPNRWNEFDLEGWHKRNAKDVRWPEIVRVAKALKERYQKVGVIGYCYGGWSLFRLGSREFEPRLVDCMTFPVSIEPKSAKGC